MTALPHTPAYETIRVRGNPMSLDSFAELASGYYEDYETLAPTDLIADEEQYKLLVVGSLGATTLQAAIVLETTEPAITETRDVIIAAFAVPNMAAVVHQAIKGELLPVEREQRQQPRLGKRGEIILDGIRQGEHNKAIAKRLARAANHNRRYSADDVLDMSIALFSKLGSNGRTNAVRRSHELGIE